MSNKLNNLKSSGSNTDFQMYLDISRSIFVRVVQNKFNNNDVATEIENFLICFDNLRKEYEIMKKYFDSSL